MSDNFCVGGAGVFALTRQKRQLRTARHFMHGWCLLCAIPAASAPSPSPPTVRPHRLSCVPLRFFVSRHSLHAGRTMESDTEGIRTPAGRAHWISSPSP